MTKQTKDVFVCSYALSDYQTNLNKPQYYLKDLVFFATKWAVTKL